MRSLCAALVAGGLFAIPQPTARADQVIINGVNHTNAKIVGLNQGRLLCRLADGRTVTPWVDEVQLILVDRGGVFDDFNQAEQFMYAGDAPKAAARYERVLRLTQEFWPDLIACRLTVAHNRAMQIDRSAQNLVRILNSDFAGLAIAARLFPANIPEKRDGRVTRTLDFLAEESRKLGEDDRRVLLDVLRYEILAKSDPNAARPLARGVAETPVPAPARTERVYGVILQAMKDLFAATPTSLALSTLDRAIRDCPDRSLPGFLLLKGQVLLHSATTRAQLIHAAWSFMRVPIHMPNDDLAPKALLEAAIVLHKLEKVQEAKALLVECYNHPKASPEIRSQAESGNITTLDGRKPQKK